MRKHYSKKRLSCNSTPDISMYNSPCKAGLPLDAAFQKSFPNQTAGGYFLDVGANQMIRPGVPPVEGYSECCQPVFNTSGNGSHLASVNGNPVCGGGRRNKNTGKRATKSNAKKRTQAKYGKHTQKHVRASEAKKQNRTNQTNNSGNNRTKSGKKGKGNGKKKKTKQKGAGMSSVFDGNMSNRTFGCTQPNWNSKCI
jgi:hypothetical protein